MLGKAKKSGKSLVKKKKKSPAEPVFTKGSKLDITVNDQGMLSKTSSIKRKLFENLPRGFAGVSRAARLLLAIGPDQAALVLREMKSEEIEKLMSEMVRIDKISAGEKKEILKDFENEVSDFEAPIEGGIEQVKQMLEMGLGPEKAQEMISRISQRDLYKDFEFLEKIEPGILASALSHEHSQIAAVALSYLKPRIAANILQNLSEDFRAEVAMRIAKTTKIYPEAIQRVARVLREKFEKRNQEEFSEVGGANSLANILNHMDRTHEDEILNVLGQKEPDMLEDVKDKLYVFEEIVNLTHAEMRQLISRIDDDEIMSSALRGVADELRLHFFNSMSNNRAADILDEMDRRGPLTMREINEARAWVLNTARQLDDENLIIIKKTKEEYI